MAGHVPKYGGQNAGNFTEAFTLARPGGKSGSGDSGASQEEHQPPLRNSRGAGRGGAPGAAPRRAVGSGPGGSGSFEKEGSEPPRRGSGSHERETGSNRSSHEGNRPSPPTRGGERETLGRGGGSRGGGGQGQGQGQGQDSSSRGGRKPRNVNDDYAAASHLPKFGDWNTSEAGDANYTVMFNAASKERQTGSAGDVGNKSGGKGSGDLYKSSNGLPKKHSSSWWCFS